MKILQMKKRGPAKLLADSDTSNMSWGGTSAWQPGECVISTVFHPLDEDQRGIRIEWKDPGEFDKFVMKVREAFQQSEITKEWLKRNRY